MFVTVPFKYISLEVRLDFISYVSFTEVLSLIGYFQSLLHLKLVISQEYAPKELECLYFMFT